MTKPPHNTGSLPSFERPSEGVIFWTLANLCEGAGGLFQVSVRRLALHCGLSVSTTNRAVLALAKRGVIHYRPGVNQARPSTFEVLRDPGGRVNAPQATTPGREKSSPATTAVPNIGAPSAIDTKSDLPLFYLSPYDIAGAVHRNEDSDGPGGPAERFAHRIASELGDLKNLALYKSYCYRFPVGVVLNAFLRAKETPSSQVKKTRGALFNFLVQLYDRERKHNNPRPGHPTR